MDINALNEALSNISDMVDELNDTANYIPQWDADTLRGTMTNAADCIKVNLDNINKIIGS